MALSLCDTKTNQLGKELVDHGTSLFPIACYHDILHENDVPWHWHDELEAVIVSEGTALIFVENMKYTVKQGEGFFINAGVLHAAQPANASACRFHSVVFHPRLIGGSIDSIFWQNYIYPLLTNTLLKYLYLNTAEAWHQNAIQSIESAWQNCVNEPFGYEFKVRYSLSELVTYLANYHPITLKHPSQKIIRNNERIKIMLHYIQHHYTEQITVSILAKQAMISDSECLRCFKSTIGMPPIQYLKQFRIQKSAQLLLSTNDKINLISELCGFQDVSYFIKIFREIKGCTPSDYRLLSAIYSPSNIMPKES